MSDKRVLITGGAGFLGSHLCERFLAEGYEVICMDNLITGDLTNIEHLFRDRAFHFEERDVTEYIHVSGRLDAVLHFASPASPIDYLELPIQTLKVGSLGTHKALGLAREKKARLLLASTTSECLRGSARSTLRRRTTGATSIPVGPRGRLRRGQALRRGDDDGLPAPPRGRDTDRPYLQHLWPAHASQRRSGVAGLHVSQALRGEDL